MDPRPLARACAPILLLMALALTPACAWLSPGGVGKQTALTGYQHFNLAMSYRAEGQLAQAAAELEKAIQADRYNYPAYYHLGLAYLDLGQTDKARQVWEKGVQTARQGPDRLDYDRSRAVAEMTAALAGLGGRPKAQSPPSARHSAPLSRDQERAAVKAARAAKAARVSPARSGPYAVLFSSNLQPRHARADRARLIKLGYAAMIRIHQDAKGRRWHRVWVGCCTGYARAKGVAAALKKRGIGRDLVVMRVNR